MPNKKTTRYAELAEPPRKTWHELRRENPRCICGEKPVAYYADGSAICAKCLRRMGQ